LLGFGSLAQRLVIARERGAANTFLYQGVGRI
jgi:hypothetical protein